MLLAYLRAFSPGNTKYGCSVTNVPGNGKYKRNIELTARDALAVVKNRDIDIREGR